MFSFSADRTCVAESLISLSSRCTHFFENQSICQCDLNYSMKIEEKIQTCVAITNVTLTMMFHPRASFYFNQSGSIFAVNFSCLLRLNRWI